MRPVGRSGGPPQEHLRVGGDRIRRCPARIWRLQDEVDVVGGGLTLGWWRWRRVQEKGLPRAGSVARLGGGRDRCGAVLGACVQRRMRGGVVAVRAAGERPPGGGGDGIEEA
jgi:hypothetical protein